MSAETDNLPEISPLVRPGALIAGKYELEKMLGRGGMGAVWAATHRGLHQRVAVKVVASSLARSSDARKRFDTEARAAAKLRSRHVVQVYDNGELDDGTPFIAMEFLEGKSLSDRIDQGPIPLYDCARIVVQTAKALSRAHAEGIVHRDIKPDNIYLAITPDEDGAIAKVLDFGIAKVALGEGEQSSTRTGALLGTPLFMSPEQARGLKNIGPATDLYSLGMVAFTMLTGMNAFSAESLGELILQICTQELPSLLRYQPDLPPALEKWFFRACAREPLERYADARALADAFCEACGIPGGSNAVSGGIGTPPPISMPAMNTGSYRAGSTATRVDSSGGFAKSPAVPPPAAEPVTDPGIATGPTQRPPAPTGSTHLDAVIESNVPAKRSLTVPIAIAAVFALLAIGGGTYALMSKEPPKPEPTTQATPAPSKEEPLKPAPTPSASVESAPTPPPTPPAPEPSPSATTKAPAPTTKSTTVKPVPSATVKPATSTTAKKPNLGF